MLKALFSGPTTKFDVVVAIGAAIFGVLQAVDTLTKYKEEQENQENMQ